MEELFEYEFRPPRRIEIAEGFARANVPMLKDTRLIDASKIPFCGPNHMNILTTLFEPLISKALVRYKKVWSVSKEKFEIKGKISSQVLSIADELYAHGMRFVIAGGKLIDYCNNVPLEQSFNDYDMWFLDAESYHRALHLLGTLGYTKICDKYHVVEFIHIERKIKLQLIKHVYACVEQILESFDLRCCAVAYDGSRIHWLSGALKDIRRKTLVVKNLEPYPTIWIRVSKYIAKGYHIDTPDAALASIAFLMSLEQKCSDFFIRRNHSYLDDPFTPAENSDDYSEPDN